MDALNLVLIILMLLAGLFLVIAVLMQHGKSHGLSGTIAGGIAGDITNSSFCFMTNHGSYSVQCALFSLGNDNVAPTVENVENQARLASTYRDIQVFGKMEAYDADGDSLIYEIISYPQNGFLIQHLRNLRFLEHFQ